MRLAVFTNQFPGRATTFFARDMRALIEAGIELEVFAFYPLEPGLWDCVPALLGPDILPRTRVHHLAPGSLVRESAPWPPSRGLPFLGRALPLVSASLRYGGTQAAKSAYVSAYAWACIKRFAHERFDHVLAYWGNHAASAAYLFHRTACPQVPFSMLVHARMDLYHQPAFLATKLAYADNIFLVCEYNRRYLREHFRSLYPAIADRIRIHHLGLPLDQIRFDADGRTANRLIAVGHLEPLKGFDRLLRAIALLRDRHPDVTLDLVGGGPAEAELRALADRLGVTPAVTFHGWVAPDRVEPLMRRAALLVHPSVRPDAMPTVIKEALAVGTPVVASDLAGIPEMLDDGRCGVLTTPGDATALAAAIAGVLDDPHRAASLAKRGRAHAEAQFDLWKNGALLGDRLRATRRPPVRTRSERV